MSYRRLRACYTVLAFHAYILDLMIGVVSTVLISSTFVNHASFGADLCLSDGSKKFGFHCTVPVRCLGAAKSVLDSGRGETNVLWRIDTQRVRSVFCSLFILELVEAGKVQWSVFAC